MTYEEFKAGSKMKKEIKGQKARYIVEAVNDIGDYRITIFEHETIKDGTAWLVGGFDYQSSIDRIESGKKVLL